MATITKETIVGILKVITKNLDVINSNIKNEETFSRTHRFLVEANNKQCGSLTKILSEYTETTLDLSDTDITGPEIATLSKITPDNITNFVFDKAIINNHPEEIKALNERPATSSIGARAKIGQSITIMDRAPEACTIS